MCYDARLIRHLGSAGVMRVSQIWDELQAPMAGVMRASTEVSLYQLQPVHDHVHVPAAGQDMGNRSRHRHRG